MIPSAVLANASSSEMLHEITVDGVLQFTTLFFFLLAISLQFSRHFVHERASFQARNGYPHHVLSPERRVSRTLRLREWKQVHYKIVCRCNLICHRRRPYCDGAFLQVEERVRPPNTTGRWCTKYARGTSKVHCAHGSSARISFKTCPARPLLLLVGRGRDTAFFQKQLATAMGLRQWTLVQAYKAGYGTARLMRDRVGRQLARYAEESAQGVERVFRASRARCVITWSVSEGSALGDESISPSRASFLSFLCRSNFLAFVYTHTSMYMNVDLMQKKIFTYWGPKVRCTGNFLLVRTKNRRFTLFAHTNWLVHWYTGTVPVPYQVQHP